MAIWDNWLAMALLSVSAWALSSVFDACCVGGGVYQRARDGALVTGLLCLIPLLITHGGRQAIDLDVQVTAAAGLSGLSYLLHIYFYFRALFALNDASNAEIFNTLGVLIVPALAFLIIGEVLNGLDYAAILLGVFGVLVLIRLQVRRLTRPAVVYLVLSVVFASLVMVLQAWLLHRTDYGTAVWLFTLAAFGFALFGLASSRRTRRRVVQIFQRFAPFLLVFEFLELSAVLGSQRATAVGPSVSFVALVECSLPLFVIAFSWILHEAVKISNARSAGPIREALAMQTAQLPGKLVSLSLIVIAIAIVQR